MNSQRSRDLNELKRQVMNYYSVNADVPKNIEDALNSLFYDSPQDIYGYLSDYFDKLSKPALITKVVASKSTYYDSKSQQVFRLDVFCLDKNNDKKLVSIYSPCNSPDIIHDSSLLQYIQEDDTLRNIKLIEIVKFISTEINDVLKQLNPFDQIELDEHITKVFQEKQKEFYQKALLTSSFETKSVSDINEKSKTPSTPKQPQPKATASKLGKASTLIANSAVNSQDDFQSYFQKNFYGLFALSILSKAICLASTALSKQQVFERIAQLSNQNISKYKMPIPMISILQNGKGFTGKQTLVKEYILMPKANIKIQEGVDMISKINRNIRDGLYANKLGPGAANKTVTDQGCLTTMLETSQQGVDMIEAAISVCFGNFENTSNLNMAINIAAHEIYEMDKLRYEVAVGVFKSSDELIEQYIDLIKKNPRIVMIIDPFHQSDQLSWYKLHTRISDQCLIACTIKNTDLFDKKISEIATDRNRQNNNSHLSANDDTARTEINIVVTKPTQSQYVPLNVPISFYKFESTITVSSLTEQLQENSNKGNFNGISCSYNETDDTFLSDLCVGYQMNFMRIGGFNRSERVNKINRLIEIENYLQEKDLLVNASELNGETSFIKDIQVPDEYFDAIQNYRQPEDKKNASTKIK